MAFGSIAARAEYFRNRYAEHRSRALALLGGKCVDCGEVDDAQLDFDHHDPLTKVYAVSEKLGRVAFETVARELRKCVIRCKSCHRRRHAGTKSPCGSRSKYAYGCRCVLCRAANARQRRQERERAGFDSLARHQRRRPRAARNSVAA
jgi:hypothetical protein